MNNSIPVKGHWYKANNLDLHIMFDNIDGSSTMWFKYYIVDGKFNKTKSAIQAGGRKLSAYSLLSYSEVINLSVRYDFEISDATIDAYNVTVDYEDVDYESEDYEVF